MTAFVTFLIVWALCSLCVGMGLVLFVFIDRAVFHGLMSQTLRGWLFR